MIASVLSSTPIFYLSCFKMLERVISTYQKIMRSFLLGGCEGQDKICKPKEFGGLYLRDWNLFNRALLEKW